jgi:chemotaxis protein methyltransferase CheR
VSALANFTAGQAIARGASTQSNSKREFELTTADFERVRTLILKRAGIALGPNKQEMVYSRLARRLREHRLTRFKDYLDLLERSPPAEWEAFTNALTTNLTSFFREAHHFPVLAEHLKSKCTKQDTLMLWCAACSTGEEAYSMAMTAVDALDTLTPPVRILASDVDTQVLKKAEQGIYGRESLERLPSGAKQRFFVSDPTLEAGQLRVRPELGQLVSFRNINLLDSVWPTRGPFDAIFCRNVMIYFDQATQHAILRKFVPLLRPDGLLFSGHSENLFFANDIFKFRGKTVYELTGSARANAELARSASPGKR